MTINDIYENALSLCLELPEDNTDFDSFVVPHINLVLRELFRHNNEARRRKGKAALTSVPIVTDIAEENPYEVEFEQALIYGLIAKLLVADADTELAGTYLQAYYGAAEDALPAVYEMVGDVYAADND